MLYEITTDCRIANKEYKKGDIVAIDEVGQYFTTVMKPIYDASKANAPKGEKKAEPKTTDVKEDAKEDVKEVKEEPKETPKKAPKKKK
jgi:hypothetical protein